MSKISFYIGLTTIFFTSLITISIIFPGLFSFLFGNYSDTIIPTELGKYAIPIILSNFMLLTFGVMYHKKKLPISVTNNIDRIRCFEISKKTSMIILLLIFLVYIGLSVQELSLDESLQWGDYGVLKDALKIWPFGESENIFVEEQNDRYVRMFLLSTSLEFFQNIKILPFVASILVLLVTYLLTVQITNKRFAGIIAVLVLIHSNTFLKFDTIAVYENFWVLFYLLSLYILSKRWILSPIFYLLSFFTKAFVGPFFIMTLFFALRGSYSTKTKLGISISYVITVGLCIFIIFLGNTIYSDVIQIEPSKFFIGLATFAPLLRYDFFLLLTILPVVIGLTILSKNSSRNTESILFLILGTLLAGPILTVFTNFYEILPYRFIPLIVFFAIGVGLFFSKKSTS